MNQLSSLRTKSILAVLTFFVLLSTAVLLICSKTLHMTSPQAQHTGTLRVSLTGPPTSADPIEYDASVHHVAFRSVLAGLVTQYKSGEFLGVLADHWSVSEDFKRWTFFLREGMVFENGRPITANDILFSWQRLAFLMTERRSKSAFFDNLPGYRGQKQILDPLPGITGSHGTIEILLAMPDLKLLETLSFGLYSVLQRTDFDSETGKMVNLRKPAASGAYRIEHWSKDNLILTTRPEFPKILGHPDRYGHIVMTWNENQLETSDVIMANSIADYIPSNFHFNGSTPSATSYIHCLTWKKPESICYDINLRRRMRDTFYGNLVKSNIKPSGSFFPLGMRGIKKLSLSLNGSADANPPGKKFSDVTFIVRATHKDQPLDPPRRALKDSILSFATAATPVLVSAFYKEAGPSLDPDFGRHVADFASITTSILLEDPDADIHFMFESKEGIRLPDCDGRIHDELKKTPLDAQKINALLWDQAIIWPVQHFALGLWAKDSVDFSMLNSILPPTDFTWIGAK